MTVVVNNTGDISEAIGKGITTGLTYGLIGTTVIDNYEVSIAYKEPSRPEASKQYKHAMHSTIGNDNGNPPFLGKVEATTAADAFATIIEQVIVNFVADMQREGYLTLVPQNEHGIVTEVEYTSSGEKYKESIETPVLASQSEPGAEESALDYYGQAEEEIDAQTYDKNLWAKALVETEGDQTKRKARYIELRANQLYIEKGGSASDTSLYQQAAPVTPDTPIDISDISGTYISDITSNKKVFFGNTDGKLQFTLKQDGDRITAVNSTHDLKIGGTRKGNIIEFFVEPHRMNSFQDQNGVWRIKLDGINITGFWKVKNWRGAGQWNLRRIE
jgi:hypothetical protein